MSVLEQVKNAPMRRVLVRAVALCLNVIVPIIDPVAAYATALGFGTARGALERGFRSVVLADACAPCGYLDLGFGPMPANQMHLAAPRIMSVTSSQVTDADPLLSRLP